MEALVMCNNGDTWLMSDLTVAAHAANLLRLRRPGTAVDVLPYGRLCREAWLAARLLHLRRVQHARLDLEPDEDDYEKEMKAIRHALREGVLS
jgi:hypothetical protein